MSKHFCCCIPVRFGVFIMSFSMLLGWLAVSGGIYFLLVEYIQHQSTIETNLSTDGITFHLNTGEKIAWGLIGALYALFALFSLFGFIGAIIRKRRFVSIYSKSLWFLWFVNLVLAIGWIVLVVIFRSKGKFDEAAKQCTSQQFEDVVQNNADQIKACQDFFNSFKGNGYLIGWIVGSVIQLLWHLYGCIIVSRYVTQLEEEQAYQAYSADPSFNSSRPKSYYPHDPVSGETEMLTQGGAYPYADPHHSFGAKTA